MLICKDLSLITGGSPENTFIMADGKVIRKVKSCQINFDVEEPGVDVSLEIIDEDNNVSVLPVQFEGNQ